MTAEWVKHPLQSRLTGDPNRGEGHLVSGGDQAGSLEETLMGSGMHSTSSKCWQSFLFLGYG